MANLKNLLPFDKTKNVLLCLPDGVKITGDKTNIKQIGKSNNYICQKTGTVTLSALADGTYLYKVNNTELTDGALTLNGDENGKQTVTAVEFLYTVTNENKNLTFTAEKTVTSGETNYYGGKITVTPSAGYIVKDGLTDFTFSDGKYISNAAISAPTTINGTTTSGYTLKIVGNVTLSGDGVTKIGETNYYACEKNSTITATNFGTGNEISIIDDGITFEQSDGNIIAKSGGATVLTISGLQFPTTTNSWSEFQNNSAAYSENISGGAKIDGAKISYQAASSETLFTLSDITKKPGDDAVNDKIVTLNSNCVGTNNLSVTNDYSIKLDNTVTISENISENWNVTDGKVSYSSAGKSEGFEKNSGTEINYISKTSTSFAIDGLNLDTANTKPDGINLDTETSEITLNEAAFAKINYTADTATVTLTGDNNYKLKLGDVTTQENVVDKSAAWKLNSGTSYTYTAETYKPWYVLSEKQITCHKSSGGETFDADFGKGA